MLAKLLALIAQGKAAGATIVIVAGAATATVAVTNPDVQNTIQNLEASVGLTTSGPGIHADCDDSGQPEIVAQRNAADKLLRAAWQEDQKALTDLHGGKDVDNKAVNDVIKKYGVQLRTTLNTALDKTASMTLGRVGQNKTPKPSGAPDESASPRPSESPEASRSPKPSCSPKPEATGATGASGSTGATGATGASGSTGTTGATGSGKPDQQGRVTVAERTTLDAAIQAVVDAAIADMDALVQQARDEVAALPAPEHGKPSDNPGGKPSDGPGNKPSKSPGRP